MTAPNKRPFSAERRKNELHDRESSVGDVLNRLTSMEQSLRDNFSVQIKSLCDKLDVHVEDDGSKTTVDEVMEEIQAMNEHISLTKREVAALKPIDDADTTVASATQELHQVVISTEAAANTILTNSESIDLIVARLRTKVSEGDPDGITPDIDELENIGMELLMACSFQDVTGQRITKVVNSLAYIEEHLIKMIDIWKIEHGTADTQNMALPKDDSREDHDLLHGPQAAGLGQDDIDALFD